VVAFDFTVERAVFARISSCFVANSYFTLWQREKAQTLTEYKKPPACQGLFVHEPIFSYNL
jgi:hypothetical protein